MKHLMKRSFSMLMALVMIFSLFAGISFTASAAEGSIVDYQYAYVSDEYSSVVKNWGTRGEPATFLSPMAEEFYAETSYEDLANLAGSSDITVVNTSALYVALHTLMANAQTETTSYDATRDLFQYTDSQKNGTETTKISGFYSGEKIGPAWDGGKTWNREHTWPNSKGGENDQTHENDIMMLRPEAGNVNSSRNNKAYGASEGYFDPNTGSYNVHGDVARIMLYQYVRWGGVTESADGSVTYTNQVLLDNMWGENGVIESLEILLAWAAEDPVDTWELARNDSVQSITGTRNVFVDYPELVFALFEAEIPAGYDTPSGSVNTAPFAITANVDGDGGEVVVNGEYVAAQPYAGYQVGSMECSEGASFTRIDDVYLITANADCTVTVSFAELDQYTVTVYENGEAVATAGVYDGNIYKLPEYTGTLPDGYAFRGWVTAEQKASADKPGTIYAPGTELTIDDNYNYYALLTYLNAGDQTNVALTYELVDSIDDIKVGSYYIITNSDGTKALGTTQATNNRPAVDVTKSNNILVLTENSGVAELLLGEGIAVTEPEPTDPPTTEPGASATVYKKVTDISTIKAGGEYIVAVLHNDTYYAVSSTFASKTAAVQVTVANEKIADAAGLPVLTVGASGDGIYLMSGTKYLGYGSSGTDLKTPTSAYTWNLADGSATGTFRVNATTGTNRALAYQGTGNGFKGYATSNATGADYAFDFYFFGKTTDTAEPSEPNEPEVTETEPEVTETEPEVTEAPSQPEVVSGYVKVTSAPADWSGEYLIVYESGTTAYIFNSTDAANNYVTATIENNTIASDAAIDAETVTIESMSGGYAIKTKKGYIYGSSGANKLNFNMSTQQLNTLEYVSDGTVKIVSNTAQITFNTTSNQMRFRYFGKSTQQSISLYKKVDAAAAASVAEKSVTRTVTSTPTYTFYDATEANAGYLYAASAGSNWLRTQASVDANASWNITVNADGTCTLIATGANTRNNLQYNSQSSIFSCYSSAQGAVSLYVGIPGAGTMYYTTIWGDRACEHENKTTTTVEATCGKDGSETVICNDCGATVSITVIPATGNHQNTTTTTVDATCGAAGSVTVICNDCETTVSEETIPATGEHTEVVDEAVAATCLTAGKTEGSHCSVCNTVIKAQETVAALGHSFTDGVCSGCNMVDAPVVGTAYHLAMNQVKKNAVLYFNGNTQSASVTYRFATTDKVVDAVEVYLENVEGVDGAYRLYFMNGETKTYIRLFERSANSPSAELTTTVPAEYYTYDSTYKTLICTVGTNKHFLGTYDNYDTISGNKISYLSESNCDVSQFPVHFFVIPTEEVPVTAQDGIDKLIDQTGAFYNGVELPATVTVGDVVMDIAWTIEASDANAAKIEDGKLVLAPQAAAATYTLTATVSYNGETAQNAWNGNVVPASSAFADGTYVIWTATGNAVTTISIAEGKEYAYGYLAPASGITLTDGVLSGYVNENLFTITANGDGTYTIVDNNGNYLYSDMSYTSSKQFNVSATKPASGADWTVVANEDGTYIIYNVDRAAAFNYSSYNNFELNTASSTALNLTAAETVEDDPNALHYKFAGYTAGEQYAENEEHVLDDVVTVISNKGHFTTQLRLYNSSTNDSTAIIKSTKDINKLIVNAGYRAGDLAIYVSDYGYNWTLLETITVTTTYTNYTVTMPEDSVIGYIKLDSVTEGQQIRISEFTVSVGEEIPACEHGNVADDAAVAPTFSTSGLTAGSHCAVCGHVFVAQEVIPALADVKEYNITLGDDISVNFNIAVDSSIADSTTVEIVFNGETEYSGPVPTELINVKVAAAQMGDTISVKFTNGEDSYTKEYSVKKYADTVLAGDYSDVTKQLVTDMLAYGAAAQTYFEYNDKNLVSDGTGAGTETPKADKEMTVTDNTDGIRFYGASLVFENKIAIRYYFVVDEGVELSVECAGDYEMGKANELTYIEIADILPQDLGGDYSITVNGVAVTYSPMNYLARMYAKGGKVAALVQALYNYHLAAVAYAQPAAQ